MNIGEEICGEWLRHTRGCEFIQYNFKTTSAQGEIDVIGINLAEKIVYSCEVAIHLITGLQYVKNGQPDNVNRLIRKFEKGISYLRESFPDYRHVFMMWSPVVKNQQEGAKHNQLGDVERVANKIRDSYKVPLEIIINEKFQAAIDDLRKIARKESSEMESSVMRYLQIEERLAKHLRPKR